MKVKYILLTLVLGYVSFVFVACGNKANDFTTTYNCPKGTSYFANGNCYNQYGQIVGSYGMTGANVDTGYLAENLRNANFTVSDGGVFSQFVEKAMGLCNRAYLNYGLASCDSWVGGYFQIFMQTFSLQNGVTKLTFRAYPSMNGGGYYSAQLPSASQFFAGLLGFPVFNTAGAQRNPLELNGVTSVVNAYNGFEVRSYGALDTVGNRSLIQVQIPSGRILDPALGFKIFFEGRQMGTGTFYRCVNPNCQ